MDARKEKPFELTASLEDYLEAIKTLMDEDEHGHAHTSNIAKKLKVKMPSVTNALGILSRHGYIHYDTSHPVVLTPLGEREAARVMRRHQILSAFLEDVLRLDRQASGTIACKIEHVIDEQVIARLAVLTETLADEQHSAAVRQHLAEAFEHLDIEGSETK